MIKYALVRHTNTYTHIQTDGTICMAGSYRSDTSQPSRNVRTHDHDHSHASLSVSHVGISVGRSWHCVLYCVRTHSIVMTGFRCSQASAYTECEHVHIMIQSVMRVPTIFSLLMYMYVCWRTVSANFQCALLERFVSQAVGRLCG